MWCEIDALKESKLKCSQCGAENQVGYEFCEDCGTLLSVGQPSTNPETLVVYCRNCGVQAQLGTTFCMECGAAISPGVNNGNRVEAGLEIPRIYCPKCGAVNEKGNAFCELCGRQLAATADLRVEPNIPIKLVTNSKPSAVWWIMAFLPLIGAAVVLLKFRKTHPDLATRITLVNLGLTMIALYNVFQVYLF